MKNVLVAAAPLAAGRLDEASVFGQTIVAFIVFCLAASATYLNNDAADVEADRVHPTKRFRPIAAGEIDPTSAVRLGAALAALGLLIAGLLDRSLLALLVGYLILTTVYSLRLKHIPYLDVVVVALGFTLRALGGAAAADVPTSGWFIGVVTCGALMLIVGKRLGEFQADHGSAATRPVLAHYSLTALRIMLFAAAIGVLAGYALWAVDVAQRPDRSAALVWLSLIPLAAAVARYVRLSDLGRGENPDRLVFRDPVIAGAGAIWTVVYLLAIYVS